MFGSFESRFKQCDESEMNAVRRKRRCNRSLSTDRPEKRAFADSGQQALTVALKSALTMRRGRACGGRHGHDRQSSGPTGPSGRAQAVAGRSTRGRSPHGSEADMREGRSRISRGNGSGERGACGSK